MDSTEADGIEDDERADRVEGEYEVAVVGGGPAGLSAALYTTRLGHDTIVLDRGGGRAAMMLETHNVIGVTEETSGNEFLATAREQVQEYGADYRRQYVGAIDPDGDGGFRLETSNAVYRADRVVLAVGFSDERPDPPLPRTGRGLHYCLHCDAYVFIDEPVYVMGAGEAAAHVAMVLLNFTDDVDLLTRGETPAWDEETARLLEAHPVDVVHEEITGMRKRDDGWLEGFEFEDGTFREYRGGFPMYGSNYRSELLEDLGLDRNEDDTVAVDDHGRTSVDGVYAVGDVTPGHNQVPVAMGKGAQAGIAIHKELRTYPRSLREIQKEGGVEERELPGVSDRLRQAAAAFSVSDD
ncbi:MAG: NAD(P)/FAD-dependent oxidoreductase [Haloferacaceae archaeon]